MDRYIDRYIEIMLISFKIQTYLYAKASNESLETIVGADGVK